jgi:hypothetical protein
VHRSIVFVMNSAAIPLQRSSLTPWQPIDLRRRAKALCTARAFVFASDACPQAGPRTENAWAWCVLHVAVMQQSGGTRPRDRASAICIQLAEERVRVRCTAVAGGAKAENLRRAGGRAGGRSADAIVRSAPSCPPQSCPLQSVRPSRES